MNKPWKLKTKSKKSVLYDFRAIGNAGITFQSQMLVSKLSYDPASWRTLQETLLYKERLVNFLDRALILPHCRRNRIHSHRTALELRDDSRKNLVVNLVQSPPEV